MKAPATATPAKTSMLPAGGATAARPYCDIAYGTGTTWCAGRSSCPSSLRLASASSRDVKLPWRMTNAEAWPGCADALGQLDGATQRQRPAHAQHERVGARHHRLAQALLAQRGRDRLALVGGGHALDQHRVDGAARRPA